MTFDEYQQLAHGTAVYPEGQRLVYPVLGLAGEAGELCNKLKKVLRGDVPQLDPLDELGDVLWYLSETALQYGIPLSKVAERNLGKLADRQARNQLKGSGDER